MDSLINTFPHAAAAREPTRRGVVARAGRVEADLPRITPWMLKLFRGYVRGFIRRHFHAVRLAGQCVIPDEAALVVYCNHASWWDPMLLMLLGEQVAPGRSHYAPVDAAALERYALFKRMGMFGVEQNHTRGAVHFLQTARAILESPATALWLTPQGRFADVRERPASFQRGMGMLARRCTRTLFLPIALEYPFWEERLPEVLIWIGEPLWVQQGCAHDARGWTLALEERLIETQDALARASLERDAVRFQIALRGRRGVGPVYDAWRSVKARLRGERFQPEHGKL